MTYKCACLRSDEPHDTSRRGPFAALTFGVGTADEEVSTGRVRAIDLLHSLKHAQMLLW